MEVMLYVCCHFKISHTQNLYQFINFSTLKRLCKLPLKGNFTISCKSYFIRKFVYLLLSFWWHFMIFTLQAKKSRPCVYSSLSFSLALLHSNTNCNFQVFALFTHFPAADNISSITPSHLDTARIVSTHFCNFFVDFKTFFWKFSPTGMFILSQLTRKRK